MNKYSAANRTLIRSINRSAVLNSIKENGQIGRAEIARETGLSPASVSNLTAELLEEKLIFESETGHSSGGRRPIMLELNPTGGFVIGIKLAEKHAVGALLDLSAEVVARETVSLKGTSPEKVIQVITDLVGKLKRDGKVPEMKLLGVGLGMAGVVDSEQGISRHQPYFGWRDVPLGSMLESKLHVPTIIDNDVNTLTMAESLYGVGRDISDFLTITIGRGVGLGIVAEGKLYRGSRGSGGEFGHMVIDANGPECDCGKTGCLESLVSEPALLEEAQFRAGRGEMKPVTTIDDLILLAENGDPMACSIFERGGEVLGLGVANLITLLNPSLIVISGEGVRIGELFFKPMRKSIAEHTMPTLAEDTEIRIDSWGEDEWAIGAASLVLGEVFRSPLDRMVPNLTNDIGKS